MASRLRRLALLMVLMPQLLVLGLGQGVVVCVGDSGHMQVEMLADGCCADAPSDARGGDGASVASRDEPDCGSCSDYRILLDPRVSSRSQRTEPPSDTPMALPADVPRIPFAEPSRRALGRRPVRRDVPLRLIHLRSIVLRC